MSKKEMKEAALRLLEQNILPYWANKMADHERGGFYGRRDGHDRLFADAPRGAILNARILWAFSAAYRVLQKPEYLETATRALDYFTEHFVDKECGGVFWSVGADGNPMETKKQSYAIGFAIYGLSEYARATGDDNSLQTAIRLFNDMEKHCYDQSYGGYHEALTRDWQPIADMRLSDKDENGDKTMNTHLHILEPYTNLYRVWPDTRLRKRIVELLGIFTDKLMNPQTHHLDLFFDEQWHGKRNIESFGHDIEASWLMTEALEVLGDRELAVKVMPAVRMIAQASEDGLQTDGSMMNELHTDSGALDANRDWWVQCECVIGEINMGHYDKAARCLQFILDNLVDNEHGEWYWGIKADGAPDTDNDHAGFWKCPYHNTRMCLEIAERLGNLSV